jgi:hypothetical protein
VCNISNACPGKPQRSSLQVIYCPVPLYNTSSIDTKQTKSPGYPSKSKLPATFPTSRRLPASCVAPHASRGYPPATPPHPPPTVQTTTPRSARKKNASPALSSERVSPLEVITHTRNLGINPHRRLSHVQLIKRTTHNGGHAPLPPPFSNRLT